MHCSPSSVWEFKLLHSRTLHLLCMCIWTMLWLQLLYAYDAEFRLGALEHEPNVCLETLLWCPPLYILQCLWKKSSELSAPKVRKKRKLEDWKKVTTARKNFKAIQEKKMQFITLNAIYRSSNGSSFHTYTCHSQWFDNSWASDVCPNCFSFLELIFVILTAKLWKQYLNYFHCTCKVPKFYYNTIMKYQLVFEQAKLSGAFHLSITSEHNNFWKANHWN